jgi:transposase
MLHHVPAQLQVQVIRRPRYGCRVCEQAAAPERPIDDSAAAEALLAPWPDKWPRKQDRNE